MVDDLRNQFCEQIGEVDDSEDAEDDLYEPGDFAADEPLEDAAAKPEGAMVETMPEPGRWRSKASLESEAPSESAPALASPGSFEIPKDMTEQEKAELAAVLLKIKDLELQSSPELGCIGRVVIHNTQETPM